MTTMLAQSPSATCSPSLTPETDKLERSVSDINEPWNLCRKLEIERDKALKMVANLPVTPMQEQLEHDLTCAAEVIEEKERDIKELKERARKSHAEMMAIKERMIKLADAFSEDAASHRKLSDLGQTELTKICHRSAWDAYKNAERRVMDAVHHEAAV